MKIIIMPFRGFTLTGAAAVRVPGSGPSAAAGSACSELQRSAGKLADRQVVSQHCNDGKTGW